jgi:hypothetical protein
LHSSPKSDIVEEDEILNPCGMEGDEKSNKYFSLMIQFVRSCHRWRIIIKLILKKWVVAMLTRVSWLWIG